VYDLLVSIYVVSYPHVVKVTAVIIKCQLFSLNIVCSIFFFHKAGNFTPEMFSVIYGN